MGVKIAQFIFGKTDEKFFCLDASVNDNMINNEFT